MIDFEFRIVGDRKGGQHAIMQWLFTQFNGVIFRKNNAFSKHDILKLSGYPDLNKFGSWSGDDRNSYTATVVNYEDKSLKILKTYGYKQYSKERYDIIILRDPYNLFSSKAKAWKIGDYDIKKYNIQVDRWKQKARQVLNKEAYFINYNKWFDDGHYRKDILEWFPNGIFTFNDHYMNIIPDGRGKSSFDKRGFDKKANEMNVLKRYEMMEDHPIVKLTIEDEEIRYLSEIIFGRIV